jgi:TonB family protein
VTFRLGGRRAPEIFEAAEFNPVLIGGLDAWYASVVYPPAERAAGVEGRVTVAFIVDEAGVPTVVRIVRGVSPGLDRAAIEAVERARYTPGRMNGRAVKVRQVLQIAFRLDAPTPTAP